MRKVLLAVVTLGTLTAALVPADAMPTPRIVAQDEASIATVVRDGCGWRRHWSPRFRRCVWDGR